MSYYLTLDLKLYFLAINSIFIFTLTIAILPYITYDYSIVEVLYLLVHLLIISVIFKFSKMHVYAQYLNY